MSRKTRGERRSERVAPHPTTAASRRGLRWRVTLAVILLLAVPAVAVPLFLLGSQSSGPPSAAIVDQLALTYADPDFVQAATETLEDAGYAVDYYPGDQVTVDFYRDLPTHGYDYLVLRVHSAGILHESGGRTSTDKPFLFTAEPYDGRKHVEDQMAANLAGVHYSEDDPDFLFGIGAGFIRSSMKGNFGGATIIVMGCDVLKSDTAARAFVDKGALAVIGWDGGVSADHTDAATERLLRHLLVDGLTPAEAVARTMAEVGPDPSHGSKLLLYPPQARASTTR